MPMALLTTDLAVHNAGVNVPLDGDKRAAKHQTEITAPVGPRT
jgi:hypothetical protein